MSVGRTVDTSAPEAFRPEDLRCPGHPHLCPCFACYLWRDSLRIAREAKRQRRLRVEWWREYERRPERRARRAERERSPSYLAKRRQIERRRGKRARPERATPEGKAAAAEHRRLHQARQAERLAAGLLPHRRVSTYAAGCRCPECCEAKAEVNARRRATVP